MPTSRISRSPINLTTALTVGPPGMLKSVSSAISRSTLLRASMGHCGLPCLVAKTIVVSGDGTSAFRSAIIFVYKEKLRIIKTFNYNSIRV